MMKTKFKLLTLSASLLAAGMTLSNQAQAGAYALSSVALRDGKVTVTGGTAALGETSAATSTSGTPLPMTNPGDTKFGPLPDPLAATQGIPVRTEEDTTTLAPTGGAGVNEAGYTPFTQIATAYSWADGRIISEQTADLSSLIALRNAAEGNIPGSGFANSGSESSSTSSLVSFEVTLGGPGTLAFEFFANPYGQVILDAGGGAGAKAEANFDNNLTITAADGTQVLNWLPNGILGDLTGGTEISDPEDLNLTLGTTLPTTMFEHSAGAGFSFYSMITDPLPAGTYVFTLNTDESQFVRNNQVPEPATLALVGLGMLGMGFTARRRKQA